MPKRTKPHIDIHTQNAMKVASGQYFVIAEVSANEVAGLLVGTEVKKLKEPEPRPSKFWNGLYWSVLVECPNGETRRIGCDALLPRKTATKFARQSKMFSRIAA